MSSALRHLLPAFAAILTFVPDAGGRTWNFPGVAEPVEADFVTENNGYVVLKGTNDKSFELPLANFSRADSDYIRLLTTAPKKPGALDTPGKVTDSRRGYSRDEKSSITGVMHTPDQASELHLTDAGDPLPGSSVHFTHPDGWLFLENVKPSAAHALLDRMLVNHVPADPATNIRVVSHADGSVLIPHGPDFPALALHDSANLGGKASELKCYVAYGPEQLDAAGGSAQSFVLRRGYMATLASREDGMGVSRNYVAQDHDLVISKLPKGLAGNVQFVRVFPWRWGSKKGIAGGITDNLDVSWFYNWNLDRRSTPDIEYVPIKQKRYWPGLKQDWRARGATHLLGYNEPDRPDQADMSVDQAIQGWPELQATGLRLGSPSTSDGGLNWLYKFMDRAEKEGLRVDFVAVHYYRAIPDQGDERRAAEQLKNFLKQIHDRVKRPLWVTEWNNGANWTKADDPSPDQQEAAVKAMIEMMDETPWVERYALFNWVEPSRALVRKDGSLTPAGVAYRDQKSPVFFVQP